MTFFFCHVMAFRSSCSYYTLGIFTLFCGTHQCRPKSDERDLVNPLRKSWGQSEYIFMPHARLVASCVAVRAHLLLYQQQVGLLSCGRRCRDRRVLSSPLFAPDIPEGLMGLKRFESTPRQAGTTGALNLFTQ